MKKKEVKERLDYYSRKKFPFTKKQYRNEMVVNTDLGYSHMKEVIVKEIFGFRFWKKIYQAIVKLPDSGVDNSIGFKNEKD
jgi:hypothetical protein